MLLGAAFAGTAIEHSMLGAAHSSANPLTAHFNVIHGHAVGMMLPHVVRFNGNDRITAEAYADLINGTAICADNGSVPHELLAETLESMMDEAQLPRALVDCGVKSDKIEELSEEAAGQWTASFNPRDIAAADFLELYQKALGS